VLKKSMQIDGFNVYGERRKREVYVFNDMLVVTKPDGEKYKLLSMISFDIIAITASPEDEVTSKDSQKETKQGDWGVVVTSTGKERVEFKFETEEKRKSWVQLVQNCIDEYIAQKQRIMQANASFSNEPTPVTTTFPDDSPTPRKPRSASAAPQSTITSLPSLPKLSPLTPFDTHHGSASSSIDNLKEISQAGGGHGFPSKLGVPFVLKPKISKETGSLLHQRASTSPSFDPPMPPSRVASSGSDVIKEVGSQRLDQGVLKPTFSPSSTLAHPPVSHKPEPSQSSLFTPPAQPFITHTNSRLPIKSQPVISKPISKATIVNVSRSNLKSTSMSSINSTASLGGSAAITSNNFLYTIQVETISKQMYHITKSFDDFFELHLNLLGHFPECAGIVIDSSQSKVGFAKSKEMKGSEQQRILPQLPQQMMFVSEQVASSRISTLQVYIDVLFLINVGFTEMSS
jgi:hypothetical protein